MSTITSRLSYAMYHDTSLTALFIESSDQIDKCTGLNKKEK